MRTLTINVNLFATLWAYQNHCLLNHEAFTAKLNAKGINTEPRNPNCSCNSKLYQDSQFYQNHGCCEWCFYIGDQVADDDKDIPLLF